MNSNWQRLIIHNFNEASDRYLNVAELQKKIAINLAEKCSKESISSGLWLDLGSGTGLLANALEKIHSNQSVVRVDASESMLIQHPQDKVTELCDLNTGLPNLSKPPTLIASSFVLHWLKYPEERLKEWFSALAPGGWLAIACPVKGSFPEWHYAAQKAHVPCTALPLPSKELLLKKIKPTNIAFNKLDVVTQESTRVTSLLKQFSKYGAQTTPHKSLTISQWRRLQKSWPKTKPTHCAQLTWLIQVLLAQK